MIFRKFLEAGFKTHIRCFNLDITNLTSRVSHDDCSGSNFIYRHCDRWSLVYDRVFAK